jgi:hypothetical protein
VTGYFRKFLLETNYDLKNSNLRAIFKVCLKKAQLLLLRQLSTQPPEWIRRRSRNLDFPASFWASGLRSDACLSRLLSVRNLATDCRHYFARIGIDRNDAQQWLTATIFR